MQDRQWIHRLDRPAINQWPSASLCHHCLPTPSTINIFLQHFVGFVFGFSVLFCCQTYKSQHIWTMCIFIYSAKGTLPLLHTNGSIDSFTLSLAKLSSVAVAFCTLQPTLAFTRYLPRPQTEIKVNTQKLTDLFLMQDHYAYQKKCD